MRSARVRRMPVVDPNGVLEGVISLSDFARASENPQLRDGVRSLDVTTTLAAICASHREERSAAPAKRRGEIRA
jgi:CBS domain-containing protein